MTFEQFLLWERSSRDSIALRKTYIDVAGDLAAGLVLSYLVDSFRESNDTTTVNRDDHTWMVIARENWWESCRVTIKQADRILKLLEAKGLIHRAVYKYDGTPTTHIRLDLNNLAEALMGAV